MRKKLLNLRTVVVLSFAVLMFGAAENTSSFKLDTGESIDFNDELGKWLLIAYWASWCGPCKEEIHILNTIHRDQEELNVIVLGVNYDGVQGEQLANEKAQFNSEFPDLLEDPHEVWDLPRPDFIPRILVINPKGELHAVEVGTTTRKELLQLIEQ